MYRYTSKGYQFIDGDAPEPLKRLSPHQLKINDGIRRKGREAAYGHYITPPKPPYKRCDYCHIWQYAFDEARADIEKVLEDFGLKEASS